METELQSVKLLSQKNMFEIDVKPKNICLSCLKQKKHDEESNPWALLWKKISSVHYRTKTKRLYCNAAAYPTKGFKAVH